MSVEDETSFKSSHKCSIWNKLFAAKDNKVRDHDHGTGKCRGSAHSAHLKLNKTIPVIFHNLKRYDSYLIMQKIGKFDVKISVIPNGSGKHMAFTIDKTLVFIDSVQFINSSLQSIG